MLALLLVAVSLGLSNSAAAIGIGERGEALGGIALVGVGIATGLL